MNPFDRSLEESDPELAAVLQKVQQDQQLAVCLLPEEPFLTPNVNRLRVTPSTYFQAGSYERIIEKLAPLIGFDYVDLRLSTRQEAMLCIVTAATADDHNARVTYVDAVDFRYHNQPAQAANSLISLFPNTINLSSRLLDSQALLSAIRQSLPEVLLIDASMYPGKIDYQELRQIATELNAYLAVDVGYFGGLVVADLYDSILSSADFIYGDAGGTLGGPFGSFMFARAGFAAILDSMVVQHVDEDYDISAAMATAAAIEQVCLETGRQLQAKTIENARALLDALRARGLRPFIAAADTHLLLIELPDDLRGETAVATLSRAGILASCGIAGVLSNREHHELLCLGTSVVTNQGLGISEMQVFADIISNAISKR